jgi:hypothetical protein
MTRGQQPFDEKDALTDRASPYDENDAIRQEADG